MKPRLKELLERMTAPGPFPNMSASEGHELVDMIEESLGWKEIGLFAPEIGTEYLVTTENEDGDRQVHMAFYSRESKWYDGVIDFDLEDAYDIKVVAFKSKPDPHRKP